MISYELTTPNRVIDFGTRSPLVREREAYLYGGFRLFLYANGDVARVRGY